MKAIEQRGEVKAIAALWRKKFVHGAQRIGTMDGGPVWWHQADQRGAILARLIGTEGENKVRPGE